MVVIIKRWVKKISDTGFSLSLSLTPIQSLVSDDSAGDTGHNMTHTSPVQGCHQRQPSLWWEKHNIILCLLYSKLYRCYFSKVATSVYSKAYCSTLSLYVSRFRCPLITIEATWLLHELIYIVQLQSGCLLTLRLSFCYCQPLSSKLKPANYKQTTRLIGWETP